MRVDNGRQGARHSTGRHGNRTSRGGSKAMASEKGLLAGFLTVASTVLLVGFLLMMRLPGVAAVAHAGAGNPPEAKTGLTATSPLPGSLNAFYPPAAGGPVYLFKMLDMQTSFSGIVVDLMEDDLEGARGSFDDFRSKYREVAGLVPEWKGDYPEEKVNELGAALAAGDKGLAMNAFAALGGVCHRCHVAAMVAVQQKYHWGNIGATTVRDPLSGAATGYPRFKQFLAANLSGITVDLRQGQVENARKQFEGFRARFEALSGSCNGCHEKESRYFVDREIRDTVDELGNAFRRPTVAPESVNALVQKIGRESCSKCHRVHLPAAHANGSAR